MNTIDGERQREMRNLWNDEDSNNTNDEESALNDRSIFIFYKSKKRKKIRFYERFNYVLLRDGDQQFVRAKNNNFQRHEQNFNYKTFFTQTHTCNFNAH